jgi:hypothetical protein
MKPASKNPQTASPEPLAGKLGANTTFDSKEQIGPGF